MAPTCATCGGDFSVADPPFVLRPTGLLYHRECMAEAAQFLADYADLPRWRRTLIHFLAWARRG
jgi:hypothetical protein